MEEARAEFTDVWERIRANLELDRHAELASVQAKLAWYRRHQDYLDRVAERARPYLYYIVEQLEARGMPEDLALLPIVESAYHPFAYSPSRASGIWQFIPSTGRRFGLKQNWWYDGRRDIVAATRAALDYLEELHKEFDGDWLLALAAYNSGERNVARAVRRNRNAGKPIDFWSIAAHLPRETRGYVPSLLAVAELLAGADKYGVRWQAIDNLPYFEIVELDGQIDLATAAGLAGIDIDDLYTLNPGFNQWATDPDGPHSLLVPVERAAAFRDGLAALPPDQRVAWRRHHIARGETLAAIAHRYGTSVDALKRTNGLRGHLIRAGDSLLVPGPLKPLQYYTLSQHNRRYRGLSRDGSGTLTYTVQRGDTLWDISRQYGVSIRQMCAWNGISARSILRPGQKLRLDAGATVVKARLDRKTSTPAAYTVRKGDSLWLISRRFGVSVAELQRWNGLSRNSVLQPGQSLLIADPAAEATGA
jgi:membrane-bound lytic murein transglycosylase D